MRKIIILSLSVFTLLYTNISLGALENNSQEEVEKIIGDANIGIAEAQFYLGIMYIKGQNVDKSYSEAKSLFKKACNNGFEEACEDYEALELHGY